MDKAQISLAQMTLAAEKVAEMVGFYNRLFASDLQPVAAYGTTLYKGHLLGVPFLICPNTLANVQASQNRHQFSYEVTSIESVTQRAQAAGGQVKDRAKNAVTILDPDGNTIVFQQA